MKSYDIEDEKIGQEAEEDLQNIKADTFADAVLWGTDWTTETVISQLKKGNIELSPNFQRRDAWGAERKSAFIESIVLGLPIPQIILAERKDQRGSYIVIDGKQRLLSMRQFCASENNDEFQPLSLTGLKVLKELNRKKFSEIVSDFELSKYIRAFENQPIRTVIIKNWPTQNFLYTVFLRLNTGSLPLSPQELRQALNPGYFTSFADSFSVESIQIRRALKLKKPDYRMRDVEIVVRYFAFKNYIESYTGNLKEFLDNACEDLNKVWKSDNSEIIQQANELDSAINATYEIFGDNAFNKFSDGEYSGIFNRPVYDLMTYFFSISEIRDAAIAKRKDVASHFEHLCTNDVEFLKSLETSTKNVEPTAKRFNEWGNGLKSVLDMQFPIPQRTPDGIRLR